MKGVRQSSTRKSHCSKRCARSLSIVVVRAPTAGGAASVGRGEAPVVGAGDGLVAPPAAATAARDAPPAPVGDCSSLQSRTREGSASSSFDTPRSCGASGRGSTWAGVEGARGVGVAAAPPAADAAEGDANRFAAVGVSTEGPRDTGFGAPLAPRAAVTSSSVFTTTGPAAASARAAAPSVSFRGRSSASLSTPPSSSSSSQMSSTSHTRV